VVAVLVGRLADAVGDDALGEDAADGDGLIEGVALIVGDGAGAQATSRAPSRTMADVFIVTRTLRALRWLRKDRIGAPPRRVNQRQQRVVTQRAGISPEIHGRRELRSVTCSTSFAGAITVTAMPTHDG
jgi:hypothetical protein